MPDMTSQIQDPYLSLKKELVSAGLFKKRPLFYTLYSTILVAGLFLSFYALSLSTGLLTVTLIAILLSVISMQLGYLGHDIAHHQVFSSLTKDRWIGGLVYGLGIGVSLEHWYGGHNEHHKFTNQMGKDPDIALPLVFSDIQLKERGKTYRRFVLPHQHWYFFLFMPLAYLNYIISSVPLTWEKIRQPIRQYEFVLFLIHFTLLFWVVFGLLGLWTGVYFFIIYAIMTGGYAGFTFAPNHKGQEVLSPEWTVTYKEQVTTTRNIFGGRITDLAMGGLNYQIEHHLFSDLPRPNLAKAQIVIKRFCAENGLPYHEVSFFDSVKEMYLTLRHYAQKS